MRKNKKEDLEPSKFENFVYNYKENPRFKALVKLGLYLAFIAVLIGVVAANPNVSKSNYTNETTTTKKVITYKEMLDNLINENKVYKYDITTKTNKILLEIQYKDNIITGVKETTEGLKKFKIENDIVYEVKLDEEIEVKDMFNEINIDYINLNELVKKLSENKPLKRIDKNNVIYFYEFEDSTVEVTTNQMIKNIKIIKENENYNIDIK